jgi:hypothetical protein
MATLQKDMTSMKQDIQGLASKFTTQLDHITMTAALLQNVTTLIRERPGSGRRAAAAAGGAALSGANFDEDSDEE